MSRPPGTARPEVMMPVPDAAAAKLIEIEALRQIADNLKRLNDRADKQDATLSDVRERVIRIESNRVDRRVEALERDVDALKSDKDKRDGAVGALATLWKNLPSIAAFFVAIAVIAFLFLKATGRV